MRIRSSLAAGLVTLAACTGGSSVAPSTPSPDVLGCGEPTRLVVYPGPEPVYHGSRLVRLGPVWLSNVRQDDRAVVADFSPGIPTKTPLYRPAGDLGALTLGGWSCQDGTRLHFWYKAGSPVASGQEVGADVLQRAGDATAVLEPAPGPIDYTGYMLFWQSGTYRLTVYRDSDQLGSVVLRVP